MKRSRHLEGLMAMMALIGAGWTTALAAEPIQPTTQPAAKAADSAPVPEVTLLDAGAEPRQALRMRPPKGTSQVMKMTVTMSMRMGAADNGAPAMKLPAGVTHIKAVVDDVQDNGDIDLRMLITESKAVSTPDADPMAIQAMDNALRSIQGLEGTMTMSNRGQAQRVAFTVPKAANPMVRQQIDSLQQSLGQVASPLPEDAVGVGARWQVDSVLINAGMTARQRATFTLKSVERDRIELESQVEQTAGAQPLKVPGFPEGMASLKSLRSSGGGRFTSILSEVLPRLLSTSITSDINMTIDMGQGSQDIAQHMEMKMEGTSSEAVVEQATPGS